MGSRKLAVAMYIPITTALLVGIVVSVDPETHIIGGQNAHGINHKWTVSIFRCSGNGCKGESMCDDFLCSGTLIHNQWVLTAAHCYTSGLPPTFYQVVVGDYKLTEEYEVPEFRTEAESFIVHENFSITGTLLQNDIALIRLKEPMPTSNITCLDLNTDLGNLDGNLCRLMGWGQYNLRDRAQDCSSSKTLNYIDVKLVNRVICREDYQPENYTVYDYNVCAGVLGSDGDTVGGVGACKGDSGGGLVCANKESGTAELVGVTSWGSYPCGMKHKPTVYTATSSFLSWIYKICPDCQIVQEDGKLCEQEYSHKNNYSNRLTFTKYYIILVFLLCL